jgi:hypothetical protein
MKVLPLLAPTVVLLVSAASCATGEQAKIYGSPPQSALDYQIDTIYTTYQTELLDRMQGGPDLHVTDSFFMEIRNYCGPGELLLLDHHSTAFRKLLTFTGDCRDIFTKYTSQYTYMLNGDGILLQYTTNSRQGKIIANFNADSSLYKLGLAVDQSKPGGNQYVNVSENVFFFRVMHSFETNKGIYGLRKMRYEEPLFCKYDLTSKKMEFFGNNPEKNTRYGHLDVIYDLYRGDSIIVTEAISGKITIIDTKTNTTTSQETRSSYDTLPTPELQSPRKFENRKMAKVEHGLYSASYEPLYYNPYTHCYYRIFHPAMPREKGNGLLNTAYDKECVLMILDENFRIIDEKLLPIKQQRLHALFPVKNGIQIYFVDLYDFTKTYSTYAYLRVTHSPIKQ